MFQCFSCVLFVSVEAAALHVSSLVELIFNKLKYSFLTQTKSEGKVKHCKIFSVGYLYSKLGRLDFAMLISTFFWTCAEQGWQYLQNFPIIRTSSCFSPFLCGLDVLYIRPLRLTRFKNLYVCHWHTIRTLRENGNPKFAKSTFSFSLYIEVVLLLLWNFYFTATVPVF